jgi:hypothetical protein
MQSDQAALTPAPIGHDTPVPLMDPAMPLNLATL